MRVVYLIAASAVLLAASLPALASDSPREAAYMANVDYYVDATATNGPSAYVPVLSAASGTASGCLNPTPTATACGSGTARIGELVTQSSYRESSAATIVGQSASANGFAAFRDAVVVRGLPAGRYSLIPTVSVQGTSTWDVVAAPFSVGFSILVYGADGDTILQTYSGDATQKSFATTLTLTGIPFDAGVPFNVRLGFGHAARIMRGAPGSVNTAVEARFTVRVTGLSVVDAQGRVMSGYDIGAMSGATYGPAGITPRPFAEADFDFVVSGPEQTMIPNGNPWGLIHTPDEAVSYRVIDGEIRMWFVASISTVLMRGPTLQSLTPWPLNNGKFVPVIGPSEAGFDRNYAGAASVIAAANGRDLLMFYHSEAHPCNNYLPFIAGIGLARSTDGGLTWQKRGQVISGADPPPTDCAFPNSGAGTPTVFRSRDGRWLYMVFMEWRSGTPHVPSQGLFLARAPIESDGEPGSWQKYAYGAFAEPGFAGVATPILLPPHTASTLKMAASPSVSWNVALGRYVMVFQTFEGIYAATSDDGLYWDRFERVLDDIPVFSSTPTRPWIAYPTLVSPDQPSQEITGAHGFLYFSRGSFNHDPPHRMSRVRYDIRVAASSATDLDADGMPDAWERAFGLDPGNAGDAGRDDDADGATNLQEHRAGTHPRALFRRYLAEGATGPLFETTISLLNPDTAPAHVLLSFQRGDGTVRTEPAIVPARSRRTVSPSLVPDMEAAEFATTIEADRPIVVDRTMRWPPGANAYGSHADHALASASTTWYLAEGATHSGFELFYLIQNPGDAPARVEVEFLLPAPARPRMETYVVAPKSRFNVWVDTVAGLGNTDVSGVLRSDVPIIVERAMYLTGAGRLFEAGHELSLIHI